MKRRHVVLTAAFGIAAWLALLGDKAPQTPLVEPVIRSGPIKNRLPPPRETASHSTTITTEAEILAILDRNTLVGGARRETAAADLFASHSWTPPLPPLPKMAPLPPPPLAAPPLPFVFLGKKGEDGQWEVYLANGEKSYIARENMVIDDTYRIDAVKPPVLSLTYLPLNQAQTLNIGGTD